MCSNRNVLEKLSAGLANRTLKDRHVLVGFDGFIDEVIHVVKTRYDSTRYDRYETLQEYGNAIARAAGMSLNVEMISVREKIGGNGVILADSLSDKSAFVTYIGACGKHAIDPHYQTFENKTRLLSIADPAHTDAIEFTDGKIISSRLQNLEDINWEEICEKIGIERLITLCEDADMVCFGNWTLLIHMTRIWRGFLEDVFPAVQGTKQIFIDLADPAKRTEEDILEALCAIRSFSRFGQVTLGLNRKEAGLLADLIQKRKGSSPIMEDMKETGVFLRDELSVRCLVIHNAEQSIAVTADEFASVRAPLCKKPRQMTGAGDSFNAGFTAGILLDCNLEEQLILASASAGYYIRNAVNAGLPEMRQYIDDWANGRL